MGTLAAIIAALGAIVAPLLAFLYGKRRGQQELPPVVAPPVDIKPNRDEIQKIEREIAKEGEQLKRLSEEGGSDELVKEIRSRNDDLKRRLDAILRGSVDS